jgi:hypothetical protein
MSRDVHSFIHWLRPGNAPSPVFGLDYTSYTRAPLVSQDRRYLFVTSLCNRIGCLSALKSVSGQVSRKELFGVMYVPLTDKSKQLRDEM